jgi:rhamnosyltransferase
MIAVCLYLYHPDLWKDFKKLLSPFKDNIYLYLALSEDHGQQKDIVHSAKNNFKTTISFHKNYGADIASFLQILPNVKEPYFIKLHSKKSLLGAYNQVEWRHVLLHDFLGSKKIFWHNYKTILSPEYGAIGNQNLLLSDNESYHSKQIREICDILKIDYDNIKNYSFFGGNMFMSKTNIFKNYFIPYQDVLQKLLSREINKVEEKTDGTYSHALERIFGYIIGYNNLKFATVKHKTINILNKKAPNGIFHMVKLYNNDCYLQEDLNVYGKILDDSKENFTIEWHHMNPKRVQTYDFVRKTAIVQKTVDTTVN